MKRFINVQCLLWLALILALMGSLRHVAWGFSTLERGDLIAGYVQAIAVDLGLFGLAIGITERRRQMRPTLGLWAGVALFSLVSTYAALKNTPTPGSEQIQAAPLASRRLEAGRNPLTQPRGPRG